MKIYLDNSFLNRPFDDPFIGQHKLESEILSFIIGLAQQRKIALVHSSVIAYENSVNPISERKMFVEDIMKMAAFYQGVDDPILDRAEEITDNFSIKPLDALHIAAAEAARVEVFITCDHRLPKTYRGELSIMTPLDFLTHL